MSGRTVCPFYPEDALDPICQTCRNGGDVVVQHNHFRNVVVDFCQHAHLSVSMEKDCGLTRD